MLPLGVMAQQRAEYNRKGDEAMARQDYSDARMWYEEGVAACDSYSINQLTTIWLGNEAMRPSMRSLMNKCLNCLTVKATEDDEDAISQLIIYYEEGIGTPKNEDLASYWSQYKELLKRPMPGARTQQRDTVVIATTSGSRMRFFIGYAYSIESPYGLTFGGVGQHLGWYVRFKTNMSFDNYSEKCNDQGELINFSQADNESYEVNSSVSPKTNSFAGTVGLIVKCSSWLYTSIGVGYGERALMYAYTTHDYEDYDTTREIWSKNMDSSYTGVAAELDFMVKLSNHFYLTAGCNTLNFKYVDLNAGLGVFF